MKRLIVVLSLLVLIALTFFYFFKKQTKLDVGQELIYNTYSKKWEKTEKTPNVSIDEVAKDNNPDGLHNYSLIRGYFDRYDSGDSTLTIKSVVPFTNANKFEVVNLRLLNSQTVYCVPNEYTDPNNGKVHLTKSLIYPVKDGETLYIPNEKTTSFDKFIQQANDLTYLIIQLTKNFETKNDNYVQKLIYIGSCD